MLVFIDESGDPGFKLTRGSSPIFVIAMVIFRADAEAAAVERVIVDLRRELNVKPEFKFNKCSDDYRDRFFEKMRHQPFAVRAVVVDKARVYSPALRTVKESFYKFFVRMLMQHDGGALIDAKVVIDGSGDREFKRELRSYLRRNLVAGCVREVDLKDSIRDPLIQLADMAAGAIARSYRLDRPNANRWRVKLHQNGQLDNVWDFR